MPATEKLRQRLGDLHAEAEDLIPGPRTFVVEASPGRRALEYRAWLNALANALALLISSPVNPYPMSLMRFASTQIAPTRADMIEAAATLEQVIKDVDAGLFGSIENRVSAATFGDLLDHADAYLSEGRKEPAGVLAGVVFEDSARRVYRNATKSSDKGVDLEQVINALKSSPSGTPTITGVEGMRAKAAAQVRTKGTHAQWDEFTANDVKATIEFAREFIAQHLAKPVQ